jgi:hypothetical protein
MEGQVIGGICKDGSVIFGKVESVNIAGGVIDRHWNINKDVPNIFGKVFVPWDRFKDIRIYQPEECPFEIFYLWTLEDAGLSISDTADACLNDWYFRETYIPMSERLKRVRVKIN